MDISYILEFMGPFLSSALNILLCIIVVLLVRVLNKVKEYVVSKIGDTQYNHALEVAKGIYVKLEDEYELFSKSGDIKRKAMENQLKSLFPSLTQTELDAINKHVWSTFNKEVTNSGLCNKVDSDKDSQVVQLLEN